MCKTEFSLQADIDVICFPLVAARTQDDSKFETEIGTKMWLVCDP